MSGPLATEYYQSAEDYLGAERLSDQKHEYLAGVIYAMAGASLEHDLIAGNIYSELRQQLRQPGCNVFSSDVKTRIRRNAAEFIIIRTSRWTAPAAEARLIFSKMPA